MNLTKGMFFMFQYNKFKKIKAIFIAFTCIAYSATATTITYEYKDIKTLAKQNNLSEIENCAKHNSQSCLTLLGGAYYWGTPFKDKTIERNHKIASNYLKKSLIQSLTSRAILAVIMEKDRAIESHALLTSAATERYYPAINRLAHAGSLETDKDKLESIKWRKVQMTIDPSIAHDEKGFIGAIYLKMSSPDYPNALYWLNRAITEEDDMLAEHNIAKLYAEGKGVAQDYVTAYMYYDLAGTAGAEEKSKLAELMTSEQVLEGISRSHKWQDQHNSYRPGYGAWNDMGGIDWNVH